MTKAVKIMGVCAVLFLIICAMALTASTIAEPVVLKNEGTLEKQHFDTKIELAEVITVTEPPSFFVLREENGTVGVYDSESLVLLRMVFEIIPTHLRTADAELLRQGIVVHTAEELEKLIEDLSS